MLPGGECRRGRFLLLFSEADAHLTAVSGITVGQISLKN